jgi:hypothetical protein
MNGVVVGVFLVIANALFIYVNLTSGDPTLERMALLNGLGTCFGILVIHLALRERRK